MTLLARHEQNMLFSDGAFPREEARYRTLFLQAKKDLKASTERFELLSDVASRLLASDNPRTLVNALCTAVIAHLDCQAFFNYLVDPLTGRLRLNACAGVDAEELLNLGVGVDGCVARDGTRIVADDIQERGEQRTALQQSYGLQAYACHPLLAGDEVIGTLSFGTTSRPRFMPDELALMKTVTDQVAIALVRIHEKQARREYEENLRAIMDAAHESIYLFAADGTILALNSTAASRLGRPQAEVVGHHSSEFLPAQLVAGHLSDVVVGGQSVHFEDKQHGGGIFDHQFYPIFEGKQVRRIAAFSQDITARKQAEASLRQTAAELVRSNNELEQFAYVASHDLQEPLRAVSGYVSLIEEHLRDQLNAKTQQYITGAIQGARRMQRLISDLLTLSRVGTQGKAFEPVNFNTVLEQALQCVETSLQETGAHVSHDALPTLDADAGQMVQVLQNLIGNALKFHAEHAPEIHIGAERRNEGWQFSVRDNGIGIEAQYFQRIFLIFQRLHTRTQYPGTGIGLAICQKIIERHGGAIWVESQPGHGTTFFFTIPDKGAK